MAYVTCRAELFRHGRSRNAHPRRLKHVLYRALVLDTLSVSDPDLTTLTSHGIPTGSWALNRPCASWAVTAGPLQYSG